MGHGIEIEHPPISISADAGLPCFKKVASYQRPFACMQPVHGVFKVLQIPHHRHLELGPVGLVTPPKKIKRVDMAGDPRWQLLIREGLHKALVAPAEHSHEHMRSSDRAGGPIVNRHRLPAPCT